MAICTQKFKQKSQLDFESLFFPTNFQSIIRTLSKSHSSTLNTTQDPSNDPQAHSYPKTIMYC